MAMRVIQTGEFIAQCMQNNIHLLRLPPHIFHLLPPFDIGLFAPLKKPLSTELDSIVRAEVAKIRKIEWVNAYAKSKGSSIQRFQCFGWMERGWIMSFRY